MQSSTSCLCASLRGDASCAPLPKPDPDSDPASNLHLPVSFRSLLDSAEAPSKNLWSGLPTAVKRKGVSDQKHDVLAKSYCVSSSVERIHQRSRQRQLTARRGRLGKMSRRYEVKLETCFECRQ